VENFIYSVWFRDTTASPEDQDRDWVACICIQATTARQAQDWGDKLARSRVERAPDDLFISSSVEPVHPTTKQDLRAVPHIIVGETPTDKALGW
jgi:hypothetical protein